MHDKKSQVLAVIMYNGNHMRGIKMNAKTMMLSFVMAGVLTIGSMSAGTFTQSAKAGAGWTVGSSLARSAIPTVKNGVKAVANLIEKAVS